MKINETILRDYDIRGIYPSELNEKTARLIAQAYLKILSAKLKKPIKELRIVVGRDNRESSEPILKEVIDVFLEYGVKVDDIGLISVNDIYFALGNYQYDGGIIATASHNPPEYGGFKLTGFNQISNSIEFINGKIILKELKEMELPLDEEKVKGSLNKKDISKEHLKHILSFVDIKKIKPFKIVVDTGHGMNGILIPQIFEKLPCELIHLFPELNSKFPSRPPNPLIEGATKKVSQKVLEEKADLGIIFDVDGDRMFLIDEKGNFIRGDMVLLLLAKQMLKRYPGQGIVYNLICSHAVPELVEKWGGKAIRSEVGYRHLAEHMLNEGGVMSGEVSAHFAFKDNYYADSGFIAMVLALQAISTDGRKLSEIIKDYNLYARNDEINIKVDDIQAQLKKVKDHFQKNIRDEIDGITVEFEDWWFNVRASKTEPLLRITVEANNKELLKEKIEEVLRVIKD